MTQSAVENVTDRPGEAQTGMIATIAVTDADGEITRRVNVTVPRGGSFEVDVEDATNATANATATDSTTAAAA
ncbi:MAG: hypothetical protein ABEJ77_01090 [Halanaeroarchaeum sp.]